MRENNTKQPSSQFPILSGNQMTSNVKTASLAECLHHSTWECASIAHIALNKLKFVVY